MTVGASVSPGLTGAYVKICCELLWAQSAWCWATEEARESIKLAKHLAKAQKFGNIINLWSGAIFSSRVNSSFSSGVKESQVPPGSSSAASYSCMTTELPSPASVTCIRSYNGKLRERWTKPYQKKEDQLSHDCGMHSCNGQERKEKRGYWSPKPVVSNSILLSAA